MGVFGEWGGGPIQFNGNDIQQRGTRNATNSVTNPLPWGNIAGGGGLGGFDGMTGDAGDFQGQGPGGFDPATGSASFEDGGVVPEEQDETGMQDGVSQEQGAGAATLDPMQAIKATLNFGRQKMGLPSNFTTGDQGNAPTGGAPAQPGFEDGGVVPEEEGDDQGMIPEGGSQSSQSSSGPVTAGGNNGGRMPPDPRKALMYLTGAGNVSPDIANALEQKIDPHGQMDPAQRTLSAIAAAPSPDSAFGLMQHYRTRYNAYSGGARAALDQGNLAQAAAHATQAFANVPTGMSVKFAPARGGMAMVAQKLGGQQAQAQSQPQQSFEDGGEVDEEQGVLPDEGAQGAAPVPEDAAGDGSPVVLNPDQFKKLMTAGYDKPLDDGWSGFVNSILSSIGGQSSDQPPDLSGTDPGQPQTPTPRPRPANAPPPDNGAMGNVLGPLSRGDLSGAGSGLAGNVKSMFSSKQAPDIQAAATADAQPAPVPKAPQAPTPDQGPQDPAQRWQPTPSLVAQQQGQQNQTVVPKSDRAQPQQQPKQDYYDRMMAKIEAQADKLFPSVGAMAQRNQYIAKMSEQVLHGQGQIDVEQSRGRQQLAAQRDQGAQNRLQIQEQGRNQRAEANLQGKKDMRQIDNMWKSMNQQQHDMVQLARTQMGVTGKATDPAKVAQFAQQLGKNLGVDPATAKQLLQYQPGAQQGISKGDAEPQQGSAKQGDTRPYTKNGVTKNYQFGNDGMWHLLP